MKKIIVFSVFMIFVFSGFSIYAQTVPASVTTIAELEQTIQELGNEEAIRLALESGVLSMDQIATTVIAKSTGNPVQVVESLVVGGVTTDAITTAAANAGLSPAIVTIGINRGEQKKAAVADAGSGPAGGEEAGLGFSDDIIPPPVKPEPPTVVTGRPGGNDTREPISPSSTI